MTLNTLSNKPLVRIVDDDEAQRTSLEMVLLGEGWDATSFESAQDFLEHDDPSRPGCLILDVRMPGISGIELQARLKARRYPLPIIFLTGHGDIDMAVHVLKEGAKDFLQKPVDSAKLLDAIANVVQEDLDRRDLPVQSEDWVRLVDELTKREQQIIMLAAIGLLNRQISERLSISERTVQAHRLAAYKKLKVHNVADLAPIAVLLRQGVLKCPHSL